MTTRSVVWFALFLGAAGGCTKKKPSPDNAAPPAATAPASAPADEPRKPRKPLTEEARREQGLAFVQQLQSEAAARPKVRPSVETVLESVERAGVRIAEQSQISGSNVRAAYCVRARTEKGLVMSVCEFVDATTAAETPAFVDGRGKVPDRTILVKNQTVLSLLGHDMDDEKRKVANTFEQL